MYGFDQPLYKRSSGEIVVIEDAWDSSFYGDDFTHILFKESGQIILRKEDIHMDNWEPNGGWTVRKPALIRSDPKVEYPDKHDHKVEVNYQPPPPVTITMKDLNSTLHLWIALEHYLASGANDFKPYHLIGLRDAIEAEADRENPKLMDSYRKKYGRADSRRIKETPNYMKPCETCGRKGH
jgi:hypothetical protein